MNLHVDRQAVDSLQRKCRHLKIPHCFWVSGKESANVCGEAGEGALGGRTDE